MRTLLNPKWLWLLNMLPVAVLLTLFSAEYSVIQSLLSAESQQYWLWFGSLLLALANLHAGYAAWQWRRQKLLPFGYALVALAVYIAFLYAYISCQRELFPFNIPRWMLPGDLPLYAGTFLMPTLAHAATVLVVRLTPEEKTHQALPSFVVALAVPVGLYVFVQVVLPLWQGYSSSREHLFVVLLIASAVVFLVALARGVYILALRRTGGWQRFRVAWVALIGIVLPIVGLMVNDGTLLNDNFLLGRHRSGIFGDFTGPWWYGLAVLNGLLLCLSPPANPKARLLLFLGRGVLFSYTLYFFLVFLPFLPLSVVAVAAVGVGFLLLTPLVLCVVHVRELADDYAALRPVFGGRQLSLALVAAMAVLPLGVTLRYVYHRSVVHQALDYVYTPNYTQPYAPLDTTSLRTTLRTVSHHKERNQASVTGAQLPYLSSYFNWLVLDNLTLSETKIATLEHIFFGNPAPGIALPDVSNSPGPALTGLTARSRFDARQQAWVSWVDLTIAQSTAANLTEYATTFELPAGCFISDYYLDIAGRREAGILAEKRAAAWVYAQIRNESRDPGLLHYLSGNRVALRVFPFASGEVRRTGIQLLHKDPLTLALDGKTVTLGQPTASAPASVAAPVEHHGVAYISAAQKAQLPQVSRQPYFHFIVDVSAGQGASRGQVQRRIEQLLAQQGGAAMARFSFTGPYVRTLPAGSDWKAELATSHYTGGFYLDRAIRQVLVQAAARPRGQYPVLVVASADIGRTILSDDFAELHYAFPESNVFYELTAQGTLVAHSLLTNPAEAQATLPRPVAPAPVVAWPSASNPRAYLPANNQPDIILTDTALMVPQTVLQPRQWLSGLLLQGLWRAQVQHPETTESASSRLVQYSLRTNIITPLTAYLALENEAQKAALRRKHAQLLAGHAALDADEDSRRMSEPGDAVLLVLVGAASAVYWCHRKARTATA